MTTTEVAPLMLIAVCTRNRERDLQRCLQSLKAMHPPRHHRLALLVVENNDQVTVQGIVDDVGLSFDVSVVAEPEIGYASVRNRVLDEAEAAGAALLLGVDDDEEVDPGWARAYEAALPYLPHCAALMGPTTLRFEHPDGPLTYMQSRSPYLEALGPIQRAFGQRPAILATQNFLLKQEVFDRQNGIGLRFDTRYNASGSEDTAFFIAMEKDHGMRFGWVHEARTAEDRKGVRGTFSFYLNRNYKHQSLWYQIKLHRASNKRSKRARSKAIRVAWGITLKHMFYALYYTIGALANLVIDWPTARRMAGTAVCHLYVTTAFRAAFESGATKKVIV